MGPINLHTIRARILFSFGTLLALGALNIGVYYWGAQQRKEVFADLRQAIDQHDVLTAVTNSLNDQRKFVGLMAGAFTSAEPSDEQEQRAFAGQVDSIAAQLSALVAATSPDRRAPLASLDAEVRQLVTSWKTFYRTRGTDPTTSILASVTSERLAETLLDEELPAAVTSEWERINLASARFVQADELASRAAWSIFFFSLLIGVPLAILSTRRLLVGVEGLRRGVERLGAGDLDQDIALPRHRDELGEVAQSFNEMAARLRRRTAEVQERTDQLQHANEQLQHEITERVQAQQALEEAKQAAEAANQTKSQFLANMSHELRTPLNAIIGYSEMLIEEAGDLGQEAMVPDLDKIRSAGKHLLGLINDILDLSKVEAGRMELYLESFPTELLLRDVVSTVQPLIEKNGNTLELRLGPGLGEMRADLVKMRQILFNLLTNASKFTERGTIVLEAERALGTAGAQWIRFQVQDSGIGMSATQVQKLFQPFTQADASTTRKYGGTGLGLTITRRFCELMGGAISVQSEPGAGTTFVVRLPAEVEDPYGDRQAPTAEAVRTVANQADETAGAAGSVLVVDDDASARAVIQRMLQKDGFRVIHAASGAEGLRLAREQRPDVITLDVMMPGMDGWAVLAALKADADLMEIPVVMLTIVDDRNLGYALGAADYLTKPVSRERLAGVVTKLLTSSSAGPVLVVEDDAATRAMLRRTLEREGVVVVEAENGRDALDRVTETRPALILLDLMMPELDGFAFVDELRSRADGRDIPVVVLTAKDLTEKERRRLHGSVQNVLRKGAYSREGLLTEVRRFRDPARRAGT